ncbi:PIR Superfamily Protein [Plasmodium ovale wallikeri]|uniref:PIR Superfamily Protein n=1 Tax=Plasmodium ovale wallikeri TaxID=864142 RepID=A0A1A9ALH7_PLAOA|nr:PIR Superfamily Protein [Plasmodium ovale wallikeri]
MSIDDADFFKFSKEVNLRKSDFYEAYEDLNNSVNDPSNHENAWNQITPPCKFIPLGLFSKIRKNVNYLGNIEDVDIRKNRCSYYKLWIYEQMREIIRSKQGVSVSDVINEFVKVHNSIIKGKETIYRCELTFYEYNMDYLIFLIEQRHLDNYFKNFESIKNSIHCGNTKIDKYEKYFNKINDLYRKHSEEEECCDTWGQTDCFDYFKCDSDFKPSEINLKLECDSQTPPQVTNEVIKPHANQQTLIFGTSESSDSFMQGVPESTPFVSEVSDVLPQEATDSPTILELLYNILSSHASAGILVASIIGTILFFFFYFRSTSSRSRGRKKARKKKKYNDYFDEMNISELSTDETESVYIYTPSNRLYMVYHPT